MNQKPLLTETREVIETAITITVPTPDGSPPALPEIIEAVHARAASPFGDPLPEPHGSTHRLLSGPILADYIGGDERRFRYIAPLTLWLYTGNATMAARQNTVRDPDSAYIRGVQAQVSGFCAFASVQLPKERARLAALFTAVTEAKAERAMDRAELRDLLDAYCGATCRAGGGTGRTIDVELAKVRARDCWGCSLRAGLFGRPGWGG